MDEKKHLDSEELFRLYAKFIARFFVRMGVQNDDLDDLIQEVFLIVHRNGGYRPGTAKPTTYLANIAIRVRAVHWRKQRSRTRLESNLDEVMRAWSQEQGPLDIMVRQADGACLQDALDSLDTDERAVFLLVEIEDISCVAVAAGLNVPVSTLYSRLRRARERFYKAARYAVQRTEQWHQVTCRSEAYQPANSNTIEQRKCAHVQYT
jgi:RNA polymerase sigma-70 factor (ECF subfamily)